MSSSHCTLIEQQSVSDKKLSADTVDELQKFDVLTLKTDNCSISEALRVNMLVLKTSNFQGATITLIVQRHKHSIVFIVYHSTQFSSVR